MKRFDFKKERVLIVLYTIVILAGVFKTYYDETQSVPAFSMPVNKRVIVIDAGHGGWDPGMIGVDGTEEKDINLLIAEKLQSYLELGGSSVIVTRGDDTATGTTKRADLNNRRQTADTSDADLLVSIHQNSYPDEDVNGAQVFYYGDSENSKMLAECIQEQVRIYLNPKSKKLARANNNYYLLKKTTIPSVIVECGFLSNWSEAKKLNNDEYQEKIAWTIYMGILNYFQGI